MKISKLARRDAKQLFRSCQVQGVLDEGRVRQVVTRVLAAKPRGYFAILAHFQRLVRLDLARRTARVESAVALSAPQQQQLKQDLETRYGPGLALHFLENTSLIGGLRVRVGSDVYDGSIQSRLAQLAEQF